MKAKTLIKIVILSMMIVVAGYYLIINEHGILTHRNLKKEVQIEKQVVTKLEQEIITLEQRLQVAQNDPFEKERLAREDLLMSYTNEFVYLIPHHNYDIP